MSSSPFHLPIVVAPADIDGLDHVSNLVYLRWVLDVAAAHSTALGWDLDAYLRFGASFMVRRHEIDYLAPVVVGDAIEAVTWVESWRMASCVRRTSIRRGATEVVRASTLWAFVDLTSGRPRRIPEDIKRFGDVDVTAG